MSHNSTMVFLVLSLPKDWERFLWFSVCRFDDEWRMSRMMLHNKLLILKDIMSKSVMKTYSRTLNI